ncbi:hypothetical protein PFICI_15119 [Pestalotiopsis fici W106-1]|uniref:Transcription factor domain-containing protein n=1 Tax=Pestalotiopsis fici (strain W106-1 / CGMCC3.15140) TaxID=1229662 RepID=W3WHA5_PESFW|nr:uncharacterized protein PFICI_15119 [Pestalotiopsis fici W106-1]ETS73174.1 hypothetical protein PFICI_15119 [Pestalotiopsis fici W106-1]
MPPSKGIRSSRASGIASPTFIQVRGPGDSSWRKAVRSQAASARHSAARRQRLVDHQQHQQQQADAAQEVAADEVACILQNPESLCGIRSVDPFDSLGRSTTRTECFLMNHFLQHLATHATILIEADAETLSYTGMRLGWVQLSVTDGELLNALFLSTCGNLIELGATGDYYKRALAYRAECMHTVNEALSNETSNPKTSTILIVVALALDAMKFGDLSVAKRHCDAVNLMAQMQWDSQTFGAREASSPLGPWAQSVTKRILNWQGKRHPCSSPLLSSYLISE